MIIFIPGNPGIHVFYDKFLKSLSHKTGEKVLITEHFGHQKGIKPIYTLEEQIEYNYTQIQDMISLHKPNQLTIVGHSVGAFIALKLLERWDYRTILVCPVIHKLIESKRGSKLNKLLKVIPLRPVSTATSLIMKPLPESVQKEIVELAFKVEIDEVPIPISRLVIRSILGMARDECRMITQFPTYMEKLKPQLLNAIFAEDDYYVTPDTYEVMSDHKISYQIEKIPHAFSLYDQSTQLVVDYIAKCIKPKKFFGLW